MNYVKSIAVLMQCLLFLRSIRLHDLFVEMFIIIE